MESEGLIRAGSGTVNNSETFFSAFCQHPANLLTLVKNRPVIYHQRSNSADASLSTVHHPPILRSSVLA